MRNALASVGVALFEARKAAHLTQAALSESTGISQADISRLENGNANPTIRTLERLAKAMNCTLDVRFKSALQPESEDDNEDDVWVEEEDDSLVYCEPVYDEDDDPDDYAYAW